MDAYYINPVTLQIYYPKGINYKNKFYYTKSDKESTNPVTAILQDNVENFSRANGTIDIRFISGTSNEAKAENEANAPVLGKNMVPVKFDGSTWIETGSSKSEWEYNYTNKPGESKWANAVVKNEKGEITGYFVWIPRYAYKITYHNENINGDIIGYSDSRGIVSTNGTIVTGGRSRRNAGDYYIVHPAFTNDVNVGGWNSELQGIWVAKYEASGEATNVKLQAKSNEFVTVYKASNSNNEDTSDEQAINYNLSGGYMFGDAIYETSSDGINGNNTWQLHYAHFPYNQEAIFIRGSDSLDSDTGILSFAAGMGNGLSTRSFRPVLTFNIN